MVCRYCKCTAECASEKKTLIIGRYLTDEVRKYCNLVVTFFERSVYACLPVSVDSCKKIAVLFDEAVRCFEHPVYACLPVSVEAVRCFERPVYARVCLCL